MTSCLISFFSKLTSQGSSKFCVKFTVVCHCTNQDLVSSGKLREISEMLKSRCIDIWCLQEVSWTGKGAKVVDNK